MVVVLNNGLWYITKLDRKCGNAKQDIVSIQIVGSFLFDDVTSLSRLCSFFAYISSVLIVSNNLGVLSADLPIVI